MNVLYPRCAGLDVHKDSVVACVRIANGKRTDRTIKTFGTFTDDLIALATWLTEQEVSHVAMESTGVYWKPVWHVLDGAVELVLANAQHIKSVPGRKTDIKDAHWIADLLAHGLITASFVPPTPIQNLRTLTRTRKQLIGERTRHIQRIQKALQDANIKIDSVISDIMGKSGRRFLEALIAGETSPEELVKLASPRLKAPREVLCKALQGFSTSHHRLLLRLHLNLINELNGAISRIEQEVVALLEPFQETYQRVMTMPGISEHSAAVIVSEIGVEMERFPTANHLVSWATLCPRNDESAGKRRSTKTRKGTRWLKSTLVQVAWAAVRRKGSRFREMYYRIRARRGGNKAIIAVAAEMLRCIWHMLTKKEDYTHLLQTHQDERRKRRQANRLLKRLKKLGYEAEIKEAA